MNGVVKHNQSIIVTYSEIDGYEVACHRHGTHQHITPAQAASVTDGIAFCPKCLKDEQAIMNREHLTVL